MRDGKICDNGNRRRAAWQGKNQRCEKCGFADSGGVSVDRGGLRDSECTATCGCAAHGGAAHGAGRAGRI